MWGVGGGGGGVREVGDEVRRRCGKGVSQGPDGL